MKIPWYLMANGKGGGTKTASGPIAHWTDGVDAPLKSLLVNIEPVQEGTGDPSPDNVRPISGWSAVNVWRTGKNLCDLSGLEFNDSLYTHSFQLSDSASARALVQVLKEHIGQTIILSAKTTGTQSGTSPIGQIRAYAIGTSMQILTIGIPITVPDKDWDSVTQVFVYGSTTGASVSEYQLELGTTATDYEPYSGNQYTIQPGQTVYGGTLDVTNGLLTVTHGQIASYSGETLPGAWISSMDVYSPGTTPTIGAQVVYELATPIEYTLTPQQISSLVGENNVWADTGDVTVEYRIKSDNEALMKLAVAFMGKEYEK